MTEGHRIFFEEFGEQTYVSSIGVERINAVRKAFLYYYKSSRTIKL